MLSVTVNGSPREVAEGATLADLLNEMNVERSAIAVALNARVVRGSSLSEQPLHDGDVVEIIRAAAGG